MNMNTTDKPYEAYTYAIREQLEYHQQILEQVRLQQKKQPLTAIERSATERGLQVLVEVAIGCSKHYLKSIKSALPSEASAVIQSVYATGIELSTKESDMIGAVGMRNAIIHDYLNLDWNKVALVVQDKKYHAVIRYCEQLLKQLIEQGAATTPVKRG